MCQGLLEYQRSDGMAIAVSNGSFKDSFCTFTRVLRAPNSIDNIVAVNMVPGKPDAQSSYCSKLALILVKSPW
jgi:hypothetical protein